MHKNHRRKNKHRPKHHNELPFPLAYSLAEQKERQARLRRTRERGLMTLGHFDALPVRYPRDIYWHYW